MWKLFVALSSLFVVACAPEPEALSEPELIAASITAEPGEDFEPLADHGFEVAPTPVIEPVKTVEEFAPELLVREHLAMNFGGGALDLGDPPTVPGAEASWFKHIRDVEVKGSTIWVETDLYPDGDAHEPAVSICRAISGWVYSPNQHLGLDQIRVGAVDGTRLALRIGLGGSC